MIHRGTFTFVGGAGNPADSGGPDQSCSSSCEPGHPLIGRDAELDAIHAALSAASSGPSGLRLRGEPGIGKSALLRAAAGVAEAAGITTLAAAGAEFERDLPFTVLADLLAPWAARFLPALPPPQRQALAGAVLLVEDPAAELDHRTVAAATLSAIRAVADAGPVAVVVDDVHWCDDASHVALAYALRRLRAEPVALITGARTNTEPAVDLVDALDQVRVRTIELTGLDEPSMDLLVERQLGMLLSVPTVAALHDASRGNPLLALELAQLMRAGRGTLSNPDGLTAPDRLAATIRGRLRSAGPAVADIVTVVAALGRAPVEALPGLTGHGIAAVDAAVESGLLVRVADRVEVYHPLARNAALAELSDVERRTLHRRLADASTDPYERARHLAAATPGTDETVAAVIEGAARLAQQRGAPAAAANLAERAADLTPTNQLHARVDRWRLAATNHFLTGETARAAHLLRRALDEPGAPHRAAVLRDLARVESERTGAATALPMLAEAIALAGDDQTELAETYQRMAALARQAFGPSVAKEHSVRALRHAERAGDPRLLAACLATQSLIDANLGLPIDDALERGIALERKHGPFSDFDSPRLAKVFQLFWTVDLDQARTEAEALLADLDPYAPAMRINPLYFLGLTEWRSGRWQRADQLTADLVRTVEQCGWDNNPSFLWARALVRGHLGELDEARGLCHAAIESARAIREPHWAEFAAGVLGFAALSMGDAEEAEIWLSRAHERWREALPAEPGRLIHIGDLIEALVQLGRLAEAAETVEPYEAAARNRARPAALAVAARCRALILAAGGELDGAIEALSPYDSLSSPSPEIFQLARNDLILGTLQRRRRRRAEARGTLTRARDTFAALPAPVWLDRADAELRRTGLRTGDDRELTETERGIAALAAEGLTNQEIAQRLFVAVKTVEWNLTRVYAKLGVRSRSQLAARFRPGHNSGDSSGSSRGASA